jgi:hypothetical protein
MHVVLLVFRSGQESPNELPAALRPGVTVEEEKSDSLGGFRN